MKARKKAAVRHAKRILLIEDDPTQLEILREFFVEDGYEVETGTDGKEAKEKFLRNPHDLIVLDVVMPQFDGFHFLDTVGHPLPPVFVITGYDHIRGPTAYEKGAYIVFRKPLNMDELLAAAKRHLGGANPSDPTPLPELTVRELQVLKLIAKGHTTQEVATLLNISAQTVFVFRKNIKRKFAGMNFIQICAKFRG